MFLSNFKKRSLEFLSDFWFVWLKKTSYDTREQKNYESFLDAYLAYFWGAPDVFQSSSFQFFKFWKGKNTPAIKSLTGTW